MNGAADTVVAHCRRIERPGRLAAGMTARDFEASNEPQWSELERAVTHGNAALDPERFLHLYRTVCQHLALAEARGFPAPIVSRLSAVTALAHQIVYRRTGWGMARIGGVLMHGFPAMVRAHRWYMLVAALFVAVPAIALGFAVAHTPDLILTLIDGAAVEELGRMYDPASSSIGRLREAGTGWMTFGFHLAHDMGIAFRCYLSGIAFGLGSLFDLAFNGAIAGAVAGYVTSIGFAGTFFPFIASHSAFEFTAIVISGAAGLRIGRSVLLPGRLSRAASLQLAARETSVMVFGSAVMLVMAAVIEVFWSSTARVDPAAELAGAAGCWILVAVFFLRRPRADFPHAALLLTLLFACAGGGTMAAANAAKSGPAPASGTAVTPEEVRAAAAKLPSSQAQAGRNPYAALVHLAQGLGVHSSIIGSLHALPPGGILFVDSLDDDLRHEPIESLQAWVQSGGRLIIRGDTLRTSEPLQIWSGISPAPGALTSQRIPAWSLSDSKGIQALRVSIGRGELTVLGASLMLDNRSLPGKDNAQIFVAAAGLDHGDRLKILTRTRAEPVAMLLWRLAAPAIVFLCIAAGLTIMRNLPRFGPPVPVALPVRRPLAGRIRADARFAWRTRKLTSLSAAIRRALDEAARGRIAGYSVMEPRERAGALAARTGIDAATLHAALVSDSAGSVNEHCATITLLEACRRILIASDPNQRQIA